MVRGEFMIESKAEWNFQEDHDLTADLDVKDLPIQSPVVKKILFERGFETSEKIKQFLYPKVEDLTSPLTLHMLDKAVGRVKHAIDQQEKILIYGDYDADGTTATTLLLKTLHELGASCDYYIPHRIHEGYGLNEEAIKQAAKKDVRVIITVDTGIASFSEATLAKQLGIDLIITDHHEVQEKIPEAYAVVNPKCSPDSFQELAGVGVAFKFAEQLLGYFPEQLLDLVAIGTIADLVPLHGENRILAFHGLHALAQTKNTGLQALKEVCQMDDYITEEQIGFLLGPRINAVGRISDANKVIELLMTNDLAEARILAEEIDQINNERQQMVRTITAEAEKMIGESPTDDLIMIGHDDWHEGVLGIVASRLVQKYERPAIVLTIDHENNRMKGSGRSIPAFHLFDACMEFRELFTHFGGHSQAAGMTFPLENFKQIQEKLIAVIQKEMTEEDFKQVISIDHSAELAELNENLYSEIRQLAPFGMGHPEPIFHLQATPSDIRQLGRQQNHLKLLFQQDGLKIEAIGFNFGHLYPLIAKGAEVSIVGKFQMNEWNGVKTPQIVMEDIAVHEWQLFDHRGKGKLNLQPYLEHYENHVALQVSHEQKEDSNVKYLTYEANFPKMEVEALYIFDLPETLDQLRKALHQLQPKNIHLCMSVNGGAFLKPFPSREDFKWLYSMIYKFKEIHLEKDIPKIKQAKDWSRDMILFMFKIFAELEFITMDQTRVIWQENPEKRDLEASVYYQNRLKQQEVEKILYYSTYATLRAWFSKELNVEETLTKEEIVHGL